MLAAIVFPNSYPNRHTAPIRRGVAVSVSNLLNDLSSSEADKIVAVIKALSFAG